MTGFSALNAAVSGLNASQRALDVISQNVSNSSTAGYSRQVVKLGTVSGTSINHLFTGGNLQLDGVSVQQVKRLRDVFLEATRASAGGRQAAIDSENQVLLNAQTALQEPTDTSLQNALTTFFNAWSSLGSSGGSTTASSSAMVVLEDATNVMDQLHGLSTSMSDVWTTAASSLTADLSTANQAAKDLGTLNQQIVIAYNAGTQPPNELLDQRDTLVRSLASLMGATSITNTDGTAQVSVNGITLVQGTSVSPIVYSGANDITLVGTSAPTISIGNNVVSLTSGSAGGTMAAMATDLPNVLTQIDTVADRLATAVNSIYTTGYSQDGTISGQQFFTTSTGTFTASSIQVNSAITGLSTMQVAATAGPSSDFSVATSIGDLVDDAKASTALGGLDGPVVTWAALATALGAQISGLTDASATQDAVVTAADTAVESSAGVNLDEEMTNMILYQRMYSASAKVITTVDQMLQTLINMVGS